MCTPEGGFVKLGTNQGWIEGGSGKSGHTYEVGGAVHMKWVEQVGGEWQRLHPLIPQ